MREREADGEDRRAVRERVRQERPHEPDHGRGQVERQERPVPRLQQLALPDADHAKRGEDPVDDDPDIGHHQQRLGHDSAGWLASSTTRTPTTMSAIPTRVIGVMRSWNTAYATVAVRATPTPAQIA